MPTAIKLIKKYGNTLHKAKESFIITAESSFHGRTLATLSATGQPKYQKGFEPMVRGFKFFKYNDICSVQKLFEDCEKNDQKISGVLIEPIQIRNILDFIKRKNSNVEIITVISSQSIINKIGGIILGHFDSHGDTKTEPTVEWDTLLLISCSGVSDFSQLVQISSEFLEIV